jgi:hypothetical protein
MNSLVRSLSGTPVIGTRNGNWVWDGSNWVCDPDCDGGQPCPPFGPPVFSGPTAQPPWYPGANGGVSFGAAPPPNPVRGHMFWDGKTFWLFDGAAWVAIGPGTSPANGARVGVTTQTFRLMQGATITMPLGAWNIVPYTAVPNIDLQHAWNAGAHTITPTVAGVYCFQVRTNMYGNQNISALLKNDSGIFAGNQDWVSESYVAGTATEAVTATLTAMTPMNGTTDFVRVWANPADGNMYPPNGAAAIEAFLMP